MGQTPTPYEYGDGCALCWGPGGRWEGFETPKFVSITFAGLQGLCAAGNQTFVAEQDAINPCIWKFDNPPHSGFWWVQPGGSVVQLVQVPGGGLCFDQTDFGFCITHFVQGAATADIS